MPLSWTQHTGNAAVAVAMAQAFRHDRAARRHWLECASRDIAAAHEARKPSRPASYNRT